MNKHRPFSLALTGAAGCLAAWMFTAGAQAQSAVTIAATGVPTEAASTPSPDADGRLSVLDPTGKDEITETDIDASGSVTFNSKEYVAVFKDNVKVVDPRFQLVCDLMTVFLNKPASKQTPGAASTPAPTAANKSGKGKGDPQVPGGGGIDRAVAEGHVVILQKKAPTKPGEEAKISVGRGETATFDNKTGDMVLRGWPSLEQNGSSLIATSAGTVMTIHRDGSLETKGPSKTKLIQRGKGSSIDLPGAPALPSKEGMGKPLRGAPAATPANDGR